jgi:hypothetical protein
VRSQSLAQGRVARAGEGAQAGHEIHILTGGDLGGKPGQLGGRDVNSGVEGEEVALGVRVVW